MLEIQPRHFNRWAIVAWTTLLLVGTALTIVGVVDLAHAPGSRDWRVTSTYFLLFFGLGTAIAGAAYALPTPPLVAAFGIGIVTVLISGAAGAAAIAIALAVAAYLLGRWVLLSDQHSSTDYLLVGVAIIGTALGLLAALPIHHVSIYSTTLLALFVVRRRQLGELSAQLCDLIRANPSPDRMVFVLHCAIGAAALLHLLVSLMPEIGYDALAMHMFIPAQVSARKSWDFNFGLYIWAVMPLLVDWIYTAAYMLAGEASARLVNFGGIVLLAMLVGEVARWARSSQVAALWSVLLFLVTPLTFTESSSLFVEGLWAALLIGGMLGALRVASGAGRASDFLVAGILLGGAMAAKAVTMTILPFLALLVGARAGAWWKSDAFRPLLLGLVALILVGVVPYATAFVLTGNPVYPFFNDLFSAAQQRDSLFTPPQRFERGFDWGTLYRITFHSSQFLEGTPGAAGFQWLVLVIPAAIALALAQAKRACALAIIVGGGILAVFWQTAYLRYIFPFVALACALVAPALTTARAAGTPWAWRLSLGACTAVVLLNLAHFHAGTYYGAIKAKVLLDTTQRKAYKVAATPTHAAIPLINELNINRSPVAFFADPLAAGLRADALYVNWYNQSLSAQVQIATTEDALLRLLTQRDVEWLVVDDAWPQPAVRALATGISSEVAKVGTASIRKLKDSLRFTEELIASPTFAPNSPWIYSSGVFPLPDRGVAVNVNASAFTLAPVRAGEQYRYEATASCYEKPAIGRLQVNWLDSSGRFINTDIQTFSCSPTAETRVMNVRAPILATQAAIYASGHEATLLLFEKISFRH